MDTPIVPKIDLEKGQESSLKVVIVEHWPRCRICGRPLQLDKTPSYYDVFCDYGPCPSFKLIKEASADEALAKYRAYEETIEEDFKERK